MLDGISNKPGTYLLIFACEQTSSITVGRLGPLKLASGYYFYVGSAFGPGGVRARVRHHHGVSTKPHWHLDYIRPSLILKEVWYSTDPVRYEHGWASLLGETLHMRVPVVGLGASDCRCYSHFYYTHAMPGRSSILSELNKNNKRLNISIVELL